MRNARSTPEAKPSPPAACSAPPSPSAAASSPPTHSTSGRSSPTGKQPYAIARIDGQPLAFAGLWEGYRAPDGSVLRTFTIVTTQASAEMTPLHSRMPLILEPPDWPAWLGEVESSPAALLHPSPEGTLHFWPVSRSVNAPKNNTADLLDPVQPRNPRQ